MSDVYDQDLDLRMRLIIRDELTRNTVATMGNLSFNTAVELVSEWMRGGMTGLAIELVHEL